MSSSPEFETKRAKEDEALEPATRNRAEESLGLDLSSVRISRGAQGASVSAAERALAVARGQRLYFSPQAQAPGTREGDRLLAHELVHVAQAASSGEAASRGELEAEADRTAEAVAAGRPAPVHLHAGTGMALRQEAPTPATVARHDVEITPHPSSGTVIGGGLSIPYIYTTTESPGLAALTLQVPEGVAVVVTPLNTEATKHHLQNAEGDRSRAVVVSLNGQLARQPQVQIAFTRGTSTFIVVFKFPYDDAPPRPAAPPAKEPTE